MKRKEVRVAPRLQESVEKFLDENFRSKNFGAEYILTAWGPLYRRTLADLKGVFSRGELMLLIDSFNSTMLTPGLSGQHLLAHVEDSIDLDHLDEKWEVCRTELVAKVEALPIFSRTAMELWANGYWYGRPDDQDLPDLDGYVNAIL